MDADTYVVFTWLFNVIVLCNGNGNFSMLEGYLRKHLFDSYTPEVRPVFHQWDAVNVTTDLYLISIFTVNAREQQMVSNIWLQIIWADERLTWNASDYENINFLSLSKSKVWMPDIVIRNDAGNKKDIASMEYKPLLFADGTVEFWAGIELKSSCSVDVTQYPFDHQTCVIEIGRWYSSDSIVEINFLGPEIRMDFFKESEQWDVTGTSVEKVLYVENSYNFSRINYSVYLARRPLHNVLNVLLPIIMLSFLNQLCFLLPIESGEKIGMCMAICLTFAVFLSVMSDSLPKSSTHIPAFDVYLVFQMFLSGITIASEVLVLHIYSTDEDQMSTLARIVALAHAKRTKCKGRLAWKKLAVELDRVIGCLMFIFNILALAAYFVIVNTR